MKQLKSHLIRLFALTLLALSLAAFPTGARAAAPTGAIDAAPRNCPASEQTTYPKASISNGMVNAVVYLPDAKSGYYRGSRFDWSGVVGCLAYRGHTFFGVWFPRYDPLLHDAITGPVEEFRSSNGDSA